MGKMRQVRSTVAKLLVVLCLAGGILVGGTAPASADGSIYLNTSPHYGGYGTARDSIIGHGVRFRSVHEVLYRSEVTDHCYGGEGDGYGAYVRARVLFGDGTYSYWTGWEGDSTGCDDGMYGSASYTFNFPNRRILRLQLQLCLRDVEAQDTKNCDSNTWLNQHI